MITFDDIDFMHVMLYVGTVKACSGSSQERARKVTRLLLKVVAPYLERGCVEG